MLLWQMIRLKPSFCGWQGALASVGYTALFLTAPLPQVRAVSSSQVLCLCPISSYSINAFRLTLDKPTGWQHTCDWSCPGSVQCRIIRPLLGLHKVDLLRMCTAAGLPWVEDPTNMDTSFLRNRLRAIIQWGAAGTWIFAKQTHQLRKSSAAADKCVQRKGTATSQPACAPYVSNSHESRAGQREVAAAASRASAGVLHHQQGGHHAAPPTPAGDVLRLATACRDASSLLACRAQQALLGSVRPAQGTVGALILSEQLSRAGTPAAVRVLAAVMQVRVCLSLDVPQCLTPSVCSAEQLPIVRCWTKSAKVCKPRRLRRAGPSVHC